VTTPEDDSPDDPYLVYEMITDAAEAEHRRIWIAAEAKNKLAHAAADAECLRVCDATNAERVRIINAAYAEYELAIARKKRKTHERRR